MRRDIEKELLEWKDNKNRYPLLIRGARQVGKSYIVEFFAKDNFKNCVVLNFEFQPSLKQCFSTLDPREIINKIQLVLGLEIDENNTLLFLDEIQECPEAIMSLRYFKEKMPKMPVIGAGSLLEFAMRETNIKMPVGRVEFLYLEPFSFSEFLTASGNNRLREYLLNIRLTDVFEEAAHQKLLELLRTYLIVGGMPAVIKEYLESGNLQNCQKIQSGILQTYRSDFGKYAKISQQKYLQKIFDSAPRIVGERIKYSNIDRESRSRDLKNALDLLILAGIVKPVYMSSASGLPLGAQIKQSKFKLIFLDVGLMQNACGLQGQLSIDEDFMRINSGAIAEQFVGQELRAYSDRYKPSSLFFWARDKKSSSAEVDYIIDIGNKIFPIEVKAGKTGTLKSLKLFLKEKSALFGIRISHNKLGYQDKVFSLPPYMIEQLARIAESI